MSVVARDETPSTELCTRATIQIGPYSDRKGQENDRDGEFEVSLLHDMTARKKYVTVTVYDDHGAVLESQFSPVSAERLSMLLHDAAKKATEEEKGEHD